MVCASLKVKPKFVQFLVWNPRHIFQSSTILVSLWFIMTLVRLSEKSIALFIQYPPDFSRLRRSLGRLAP